MIWTFVDKLLVAVPLLLVALVLGLRTQQVVVLEQQASLVAANIEHVAETLDRYHASTGRWFPVGGSEDGAGRVFPDRFHESPLVYQGLDESRLWFENNAGMVLQLVQYQPDLDAIMTEHLFNEPYVAGQPYLRILLEYDEDEQTETVILRRLQETLPSGSLAEVDDHLFVVDLRRLTSDE